MNYIFREIPMHDGFVGWSCILSVLLPWAKMSHLCAVSILADPGDRSKVGPH
jgi:hypothetical protein